MLDTSEIPETIHYDKIGGGNVVFYTLNSYLNCPSNGKHVLQDFEDIIKKYPRKRAVHEGEKPALAYHIVQSFDGYVSPTFANAIGVDFAKEFLKGYRVQISTHTNTKNIHNHIIFSCVNDRGERYNDCDTSMAEMRRVSDRICEEHGISILENTKEYKPKHYKGRDGSNHAYEATPRKNELISMRRKKKRYTDDISSYRNSQGYREDLYMGMKHKEFIKHDIDECLPLVDSYEDLLMMLQKEYGYSIKAYRKNAKDNESRWLAHITFTYKAFTKGVRDSSIGENGFYERENLEKLINSGFFKEKSGKEKRQAEINQRLNALHFVEENKITDYRAIEDVVTRQNEKYDSVNEQAAQLANKIKRTEYVINHQEKYLGNASQNKMEQLRKNVDSRKMEYKDLREQLSDAERKMKDAKEAVAFLKNTSKGKSAEYAGTWESVERTISEKKKMDAITNEKQNKRKSFKQSRLWDR